MLDQTFTFWTIIPTAAIVATAVIFVFLAAVAKFGR
jgi:hypothetical protein